MVKSDPDTQTTPNKVVGRILVKTKRLCGEDNAQNVVDTLEKVSRSYLLLAGRFIEVDDRRCDPNSR